MDTTQMISLSIIQVVSILVVVLALVIILIATQFVLRRRSLLVIRPIAAYEAMPTYIGLAIESNQPPHMALGSSALGGTSSLITLAAAEMFYQLSQRAAISDVAPILTLSDTSALPLIQDTLRRAYRTRGRLNHFRYSGARWYPSGARSLAYAAALTAITAEERISSSVLAGSFGPEAALIMSAAQRHGLPTIGISDQLEGQAVAYAFSEHVLIGEEIFAAGVYLSDSAVQAGETIALDMLRWVLVAVLIALLFFALLNPGG